MPGLCRGLFLTRNHGRTDPSTRPHGKAGKTAYRVQEAVCAVATPPMSYSM